MIDEKTDDDFANDVIDLSMICQCQGGLGGDMLTREGLFHGLFTPDVPFSIWLVSAFSSS